MANEDRDIPSGHGLSYRRGIAYALLKNDDLMAKGMAFRRGVVYGLGLPDTPEGKALEEQWGALESSDTDSSFEKGRNRGKEWKQEIAKRVKGKK